MRSQSLAEFVKKKSLGTEPEEREMAEAKA